MTAICIVLALTLLLVCLSWYRYWCYAENTIDGFIEQESKNRDIIEELRTKIQAKDDVIMYLLDRATDQT